MTREEAVAILEDTLLCMQIGRCTGKSEMKRKHGEALNMAIEALNKQIPKPYVNVEFQYIAICPSCGCDILDCNYCKYCGQRIDWKEQR